MHHSRSSEYQTRENGKPSLLRGLESAQVSVVISNAGLQTSTPGNSCCRAPREAPETPARDRCATHAGVFPAPQVCRRWFSTPPWSREPTGSAPPSNKLTGQPAPAWRMPQAAPPPACGQGYWLRRAYSLSSELCGPSGWIRAFMSPAPSVRSRAASPDHDFPFNARKECFCATRCAEGAPTCRLRRADAVCCLRFVHLIHPHLAELQPRQEDDLMGSVIKFGTSGWRAIVADEFTLANIRLAVAGIAAYVKTQPEPHRVLVGRDPRFLGESFVAETAKILAGAGITPIVISDAAPTPAIAYAVRVLKTSGAINFTASHNPPEYNGIKFSTHDGAPALPEVTKQIEAAINANTEGRIPHADPPAGGFETADVKPGFLRRLSELVDLKTIAKSHIKVVYDPFWGAGRGYTSDILREAGVDFETVHDYRDVLFGGHAPEPDDHLLGDAKKKMKEFGAKIGIATDGDVDRFGIVDGDGTFIQPNYVIALLLDYLVETRGWKNGVAKSVATTNLISGLARHHKVELYETPVGFKYIGELIKQDKITIGGEESAGL